MSKKIKWLLIVALCLAVCLVMGISYVILPEFETYQRRTTEAQTRTAIQFLRFVVNSYNVEQGVFPTKLDENALFEGRPLPMAHLPPHHEDSNRVAYMAHVKSDDSGGWGYVNNSRDKNFGKVFVNCTHLDARGNSWASQ